MTSANHSWPASLRLEPGFGPLGPDPTRIKKTNHGIDAENGTTGAPRKRRKKDGDTSSTNRSKPVVAPKEPAALPQAHTLPQILERSESLQSQEDVADRTLEQTPPVASGAQSRPPGPTCLFINNTKVMSKSKSWTGVLDPASQRLLSHVPDCTLDEVQKAVDAAKEAQPDWADMPFISRRELLLDLARILSDRSAEFANVLVSEVGKTLPDAETEISRGLDSLHSACSIGGEMAGLCSERLATQCHTTYEPLGVCISVTPFNFPFMIPLWSIPFAIITGNTVVLKPSERTPTVSTLLADAFVAAGFPPGVFNIVHGGPTAVDKLLAQPTVQTVSFVGSDLAAERVYEHARATRKRVQAECGGKNHGVVLEDADQMATLYAIAGSAFGAAGQRCMAMSVAVLVGPTKSWTDKLVELAKSLVVGPGHAPNVSVGPLISASAKARVEGIIENAVAEGATLLLDGRGVQVPECPRGNFVGPTILKDVKKYMECYQTEIFGPVLICMEVETLEEAIELVNENRYGNGCSIFTTSPKNARKFQTSVNVGQIGVNVPVLASSGMMVRSSNKDSFLGDLNCPGRTYWPFFTRTKTITSRWT